MTLETVLKNIEQDDTVKVMALHYTHDGDVVKTKISYGKVVDTLHLFNNSLLLNKVVKYYKIELPESNNHAHIIEVEL